ncbi:hypothetical protein KKE19_02500 [Patescibacteria group bacterium]|nr:hypothetical protein [Patescibacteria group bacterium]MBU4367706.1 hypothetical protein [Patescibacteria group bacterium]MBU4461844.1 hypothetical protein [Patescibacteria group bacterium]MCG2700025.1 hypothetical protein [Candidatus Parcubacteria bacterium]
MDIKFSQLLISKNGKRNGKVTEALFEVGDRDIKIGVTDIFLGTCKSIVPGWTAELFLKQFGELIIRKMIVENNLSDDYVFKAHNFLKGNDCMSLEEIKEKLENDIIGAEKKRNSIGFKI